MSDKVLKYFGEKIKLKENKTYNYDLFSKVSDNAAFVLSKSNVISFKNGTVINYLLDQNTLLSNFESNTFNDYHEAIKDKSYWSHPFSIVYNMELRAKYLLQTSVEDKFKDLKEELFTLIEPLFFESNLRIPVLKEAMQKAESRLFNSHYTFIGPVDGHEQNELSLLEDKNSGVESLGREVGENEVLSDNSIMKEVRTDSHDLLALKELILILRKEKKIDRFSIALSFFNKYIPELDEMGFKTILMTVKDGEIINFQMNPYMGKEFSYKQDYGVQKASSAMGVLEKLKRFPNGSDKLEDDEMVFVSTLGYVATKENLEMKNLEKNIMDKPSLCAETFVYEKYKGTEYGTRLCFTPMNYDDFPLLLRNGSVIFGLHDYSFHSTVKIKKENFPIIRNLFLDNFKNEWHWSEGWVAGRYLFKNFEKIDDKYDMFFFYREENEESLMKIINSYYEEFPYTYELYSKSFSNDSIESEKYAKNTKPLHKRMTLSKYVNDNSFDYVNVICTWKKIANEMESDQSVESIKRLGLRENVMKLIKEENMNMEDAIKKVMNK